MVKGSERNLTKVLLGVTEVVIGNSLQTKVGKKKSLAKKGSLYKEIY